jgi:hypothetical protein
VLPLIMCGREWDAEERKFGKAKLAYPELKRRHICSVVCCLLLFFCPTLFTATRGLSNSRTRIVSVGIDG